MNKSEIIDKVLRAYTAYYDVKTEEPTPPFFAEANFHSHDEQYFLVKSARIGETESNEKLFFAEAGELTDAEVREFDDKAWEEGLKDVKPHGEHKNSDVALVIICDSATKEARNQVKKLNHYKSYKMGLWGFSRNSIVLIECESGRLTFNRQGALLKKLFKNILIQ